MIFEEQIGISHDSHHFNANLFLNALDLHESKKSAEPTASLSTSGKEHYVPPRVILTKPFLNPFL